MTTSFAQLPLEDIHAHLHNPRKRAVADDDMVDSIRTHGLVEPLIVAPAADGYVLIAGHRRKNGLEQAGIKTAPALIRTDLVTEAQQIEAMLIENGHREDLTPIEEADGYEQLELFGYKPKDIAKATGRSESTVRSRLKLRKLSTDTRTKLHEGQVTIHDALELLEFADDPKVLAKLEAAAGTSNFQYVLTRARRDVQAAKEQEKLRARVSAENIPEAPLDEGDYWRYDKGPYPILWLHEAREEAKHDGCLAWTCHEDRVWLTCTDPAAHRPKPAETSPEEKARRQAEQDEWNRQAAEREARREALAAAAQVRVDHAAGLLTTVKLPDTLLDFVQAVLPAYLLRSEAEYGRSVTWAQEVLGCESASQALAEADDWSRAQLTKALAAILLETAEDLFESGLHNDIEDPDYPQAAHRYLQWLADTDHSFCEVDQELRDQVEHAITVHDSIEAADEPGLVHTSVVPGTSKTPCGIRYTEAVIGTDPTCPVCIASDEADAEAEAS